MLKKEEFLHNLGKNICEVRKQLNMSQIELAELTDLSLTEAVEEALSTLPAQKQRDVVEILRIISRLTTK